MAGFQDLKRLVPDIEGAHPRIFLPVNQHLGSLRA